MMKISLFVILTFLLSSILYGQNWSDIKGNVTPIIEVTAEYDSIYPQPLSTVGWEDGLHISEDGLKLYCTYVPIDLLSFVLNGDLPNDFSANYLRGAPEFGMDLITNPIGASEWLHSDILFASRNSLSEPFSTWTLSNMARAFYSEGAPAPLFSSNTQIEVMAFTSNDNTTNNTDIWTINNTVANPTGEGLPFESPINTEYQEDNPHLLRFDDSRLVLFFDSENLPGGLGDSDLWFTESNDNGENWSAPTNISSVNTSKKEHQPFLHYDLAQDNWFLYYSAYHSDGKLAIFRRKQRELLDWNSWGEAQLVISAGSTAGIGEPTLTKRGDISFVVIYEDPEMNSIYNHFDSDPWFARRKEIISSVKQEVEVNFIAVYPNPAKDQIKIESKSSVEHVIIYGSKGEFIFSSSKNKIDVTDLKAGVYVVSCYLESGAVVNRKLLLK